MILSAQSIRELCLFAHMITPFVERTDWRGSTHGLGPAGYDIRLKDNVLLAPGGERGSFQLASSLERFIMPRNLIGLVKDKSSHARAGMSVFNTVLEPGWTGWLTLELVNHGWHPLHLVAGEGVAQVVFHTLDAPTEQPYAGGYQNQPNRPVRHKQDMHEDS